MREIMAVTKALSDENRVRIVLFLRHGELCVCQIVTMLELAPSTVSKHLSILTNAGLLTTAKRGRWHHYALAGPEAGPKIYGAIEWLLDALRDDPQSAEDDKKREKVCCTPLEDLLACYSQKS